MGEFIPRPDLESTLEEHARAAIQATLAEIAERLAGHPQDEVLAELRRVFDGWDEGVLDGWAQAISDDR